MAVKNRFQGAGGFRLNPLKLARSLWEIDDVPVTVTAAQLNNLSNGSSPVTLIYVDGINGNDITGDGQIGNPFETINAANNFITDNSFIKPYTIICGTAIYEETSFQIKPFVYLDLSNSTLNVSGDITLHGSWDQISANQLTWYVKNGFISANLINFDFNILTNSFPALISIDSIKLDVTSFTMLGKNNPTSQILLMTSITTVSSNGLTIVLNNVKGKVGDSQISDITIGTTTNSTLFFLNSNFIGGTVTLNSAGIAATNVFIYGSPLLNNPFINGANSVMLFDASSFSLLPMGTHLNNYTLLSVADGILANFTPNKYIPVNNSVKGHLIGINNALTPFIDNDLGAGPILMSPNNGYINKDIGNVYTLPINFNIGDRFRITGHTGSWQLMQQAGQQIFFGDTFTTIGIAGSLASTNDGDCIELLGVTANTELRVFSNIGDLTII